MKMIMKVPDTLMVENFADGIVGDSVCVMVDCDWVVSSVAFEFKFDVGVEVDSSIDSDDDGILVELWSWLVSKGVVNENNVNWDRVVTLVAFEFIFGVEVVSIVDEVFLLGVLCVLSPVGSVCSEPIDSYDVGFVEVDEKMDFEPRGGVLL